jgi:hypothetical protein
MRRKHLLVTLILSLTLALLSILNLTLVAHADGP